MTGEKSARVTTPFFALLGGFALIGVKVSSVCGWHLGATIDTLGALALSSYPQIAFGTFLAGGWASLVVLGYLLTAIRTNVAEDDLLRGVLWILLAAIILACATPPLAIVISLLTVGLSVLSSYFDAKDGRKKVWKNWDSTRADTFGTISAMAGILCFVFAVVSPAPWAKPVTIHSSDYSGTALFLSSNDQWATYLVDDKTSDPHVINVRNNDITSVKAEDVVNGKNSFAAMLCEGMRSCFP